MRERLKRLLSILIKKDSESINELALQLKVTPRTIRNEVREINDVLASNQLPQLYVKKGIINSQFAEKEQQILAKMAILNDQNQNYLSPQQRVLFLLLAFLTSKEPVFIIEVQEELEISKSTMDSDMRDLRMLLQPYNLRLTTDLKKGAHVVGNERTIRMMFCDLIIRQIDRKTLFENEILEHNSLINRLRQVFSHQELQLIDQQIMAIFGKGNLATNDNYRYQAVILTMIWIVRIKNKKFIEDDVNVENFTLKAKQSSYINALIAHFNLKIESGAELRYMAFIIASFDKNEDMALDSWMKSQVISVSLIESMEESLGLPFSKSESLFEEVYYHIASLLVRYEQNLSVFNPLKTTIKQSYPEIFSAVRNFTETLDNKYDIQLSDDENGYLAMYFSAAQVEIKKNRDFKFRIAVVCNYGMATGKLLAAKLEERFNVDVIAVLSAAEVDILKKLRVDLVFKTVDIEIKEIPSMQVNPIPTDKDLNSVIKFLSEHAELSRYEGASIDPTRLFNGVLTQLKESEITVSKDLVFQLQRVFYANHLNINEREVQPMLKDIINDSEIQLNQKAKDWQEAIQISAQPLVGQDFISPHYVDAMISSVEEFGPYIVIGPSIALAHARPEDGAKKLGVSITTLDTPVNFGNPENDPVSIVFCLAAVDNYSHLNVMKSIVQLINDQEKVKKLSKLTNVSAFKELLFNNENEVGGN